MMTLEELERVVLTQGNTLRLLDDVIKAARIGVPKVLAFRCSHSGLYYPANYVKEWGRKFGIGLGSQPVSECWNTVMEGSIATLDRVRTEQQLMFPIATTMAQIDLTSITEEEFKAQSLIPAEEDPEGEDRAEIVFAKQMEKLPELRLRVHAFRAKRGVA